MNAAHARALTRDIVESDLSAHDARMEAGCLKCGSAVPLRLCPDCYVCVACGPGCDECAPLRGAP